MWRRILCVVGFCVLSHVVFWSVSKSPSSSSSFSPSSHNATTDDYFHFVTSAAHTYLLSNPEIAESTMHHVRAITRTLVVLVGLHLIRSSSLFRRTGWAILSVTSLSCAAAIISNLSPRGQNIPLSIDLLWFDPVMLPVDDRYLSLAPLFIVVQLCVFFALDRVFADACDCTRLCLRVIISSFIVFSCVFLILLRMIYTFVLVFMVPGAIYLYRKMLLVN